MEDQGRDRAGPGQPGAMPGRWAAVVISDLMMGSRVREALKRMELGAIFVSDPEGLARSLTGAALLIADMNDARLPPLDAVRLAKRSGVPVLAYGSHVDAGPLAAAREAGADQVVPRSVFSAQIDSLIRSLVPSVPGEQP